MGRKTDGLADKQTETGAWTKQGQGYIASVADTDQEYILFEVGAPFSAYYIHFILEYFKFP